MTVPTGLFLPWLNGGQNVASNPQTYIYQGAGSPNQTVTRWGDGSGWQYNFLGVSTRTSNVLTLVDNGYVGINCNAPQTALDVNGNGRFYQTSGTSLYVGNSAGAYFSVATGTGGYAGLLMNGYFQVASNGGTSTILFQVPSDGGGNVYWNGTGKFGIGTSSPAYSLDVAGPINTNSSHNVTNSTTLVGKMSGNPVYPGLVSTLAGSGSALSSDGTGINAGIAYPWGICVDSTGSNAYFCGQDHKVRKIVIATGVVTTLAGSGAGGGTNGTGTAATFNYPVGICIDSTNTNLYVADSGGHLIRKIVISSGVVTTLAGTGTAGGTNGTGTGASFNAPYGICLDASGTYMYVAEYAGNRIRQIVVSSGVVNTFAGATGVTAATAGSNNATGSAATFNAPFGIVCDSSSNVYVGEYGNSLLRKITSGAVVTTLAGNGSFADIDGTGTGAGFNGLSSITIDSTSSFLFTTDYWANSVRKVVISSGVVTTVGSINSLTDGTTVWNSPHALTWLNSNYLLIADSGGCRIRRLQLNSNASTMVESPLGNTQLRIGPRQYLGAATDATTIGLERSRHEIHFAGYRDAMIDKIGSKIVSINKQAYGTPGSAGAIQTADLAFFTSPYGGEIDPTVERMRITDNGNVVINGYAASNSTYGGTYATGGAITITNGYAVHVFTASGTFTPLVPLTVQVLVVGGGGAGGNNQGGGGGAGGALLTSTSVSGATTVTVGAGGTVVTSGTYVGNSGGTSSFGSVSVIGGGGGGAAASVNGVSGGCGGGGGYTGSIGGTGLIGGNGGVSFTDTGRWQGGGGGGMGGSGANASTNTAGTGGAGLSFTIGGVSYLVAGGGGGQLYLNSAAAGGAGGSGIGGTGAVTTTNSTSVNATNPTANTGSGGGGGNNTAGSASAGASGIVVVAYPIYSLDIGGTLRVQGSANISGGASALPTTVTSNHWTVSGFSNTITSITGSVTSNVTNNATIYTFTSGSGGFTVPAGGLVVDYLIVGGGGGGGTWVGGGGGAGGLVYAKDVEIPAGTYTWTVGAGGASTSSQSSAGGNGGNSSVSTTGLTITALGGGGGGTYNGALSGLTGGSGGGGTVGGSGGTAAIGQGNIGGNGLGGGGGACGGGGGAGSAGGSTVGTTSGVGSAGGNGLSIAITGSNVYYAGGGGSCGDSAQSGGSAVGPGGLGGGGTGGLSTAGGQTTAPTSGVANTGGGGGGGTRGGGASGTGGSGVIILRVYTNTNTRMLIGDGTGYSMSLASQSNTLTNDVFTVSDQGNVSIGMSNAQLGGGSGIASDSSGNIYFSDLNNHRVRKISATGIVTTLAGNGLATDSAGYGTGASINGPGGLALDPAGTYLYVTTNGNRVLQINTSTQQVVLFAGSGSLATISGSGPYTWGAGNDGTGTAAKFYQPKGICIDSTGSYLFVTDMINDSTGNSSYTTYPGVIRKITVPGGVVATLSNAGVATVIGNTSYGITIDTTASNLFTVSYRRMVVQKITGIFVGTSCVVSTYAGTLDSYGISSTLLNFPGGVFINPAKTLMYVSDASGIRSIAYPTAGSITVVAGSASGYTGYLDATGTSALLYYPQYIASDSSGSNFYFIDYLNYRIRKLNVPTSNVTTYAGTGVSTYLDGSIPTVTNVNNTLSVQTISNASNILSPSTSIMTIGTNTTAANNIVFSNYGGGIGNIALNSYNIQIGNAQNGTITLNSGSSGYVMMTAGSGVGINCNAPAYTLDVNGTTNVASNMYVATGAGVAGAGSLTIGSLASTGTNGVLRLANVAGSNFIQSAQNTSSGSWGSLIFGQYNSYNEYMRIHSNGFVGIATSSPATALDVNGGVTIRNGIRTPFSTVASGVVSPSSSSYGTIFNITSSAVTQISLPTVTWASDVGAYWTFRNNTSGYLPMNMTYSSTANPAGPTIITIPPSNSVTILIAYSAAVSCNYILM